MNEINLKLKVKETILIVQKFRLNNALNRYPLDTTLINYLTKDIVKLSNYINRMNSILNNLN